MSVASRVHHYLANHGVSYEVIEHERTLTSTRTAQMGHVSGDRLAKAVVLKDEQGFMMAVLPASCHVQLARIKECLDRPIGLATEQDIGALFPDCELGAVPALGPAYGMEMVVDEGLDSQPDVYLEGGDHTSLIHLTAEQFRRVTREARHARFARHD